MKDFYEFPTHEYGQHPAALNWKGFIMRLIFTVFILTTVFVSGYAERSSAQLVSVNRTNVSLATVVKDLRQQTGFGFVLDRGIDANRDIVSLARSGVELSVLLDELTRQLGYGYTIQADHKVVFVSKASNEVTSDREGSVAESNESHLVLAIPTVTGRITDTLGQPLAGASVVVLSPEGKRTSLQTTTKANGIFVLEDVPEGAMLRISFMGYVEQQVQARAQMGNVVLKPSESPLDEVQVIAYGTTSRRLSTGNIATVKAKDIENQPIQNPLLALHGRVPGLIITQATGVAGGAVRVRIQGQNSIRSGNDPFFVVDGVPIEPNLQVLSGGGISTGNVNSSTEGNPLNYLNPYDIESIDVLKDADATSIYGSRAANGAILITTKKGKPGKTNLTANLNHGWSKAPYNGFKMLNTRQYLDMRYEAFRNDGIDWQRDLNVFAPDLLLWDTTRYTNWQKELLSGTSFSQHVQLTVSGGTVGTQYRLSGTYNRASSIFPDQGNGNPSASVSASINSTSPDQRLTLQWTANYQYNRNELPSGNFLQAALMLAPNAPDPFNEDGSINWAPDANGRSTYLLNPYAQISNVYTNTTANLISNVVLGYRILNGLNFRTSLGYRSTITDDFSPITTSAIQPELRSTTQNQAFYGSRNVSSWIAEPQLNYQKTTVVGKFDVLVASTFSSGGSTSKRILGVNYPSDELLNNIASAASISTFDGLPYTQNRYLAHFGVFNWNLYDQWILNVNLRRDGSPRFGENKRFSSFYSVGGAWLFSNQKVFQKNLPWLSFGKIRSSYGVTGNDQIGDYLYVRTYSTFNLQVPYQGISALQSPSLPNPDLVWERVRKLSVGLDLGFLKDRILLNLNYGHNTSDNQLMSYPLPSVTGSSSVNSNLDARIRNTTWEVSVNTVNFRGKHFEWSTNLNLSRARNILVSYENFDRSPFVGSLVIGQPLDLIRLYRFGGVDAATGEYQYLDKDGNVKSTVSDLTLDDQIIRSFAPPFYGGIGNTLRFKNFSLDFFIQLAKQWAPNTEYSSSDISVTPGVFNLYQGSNQPITVLDRWRAPGDAGKLARFSSIGWNSSLNIMSTDVWYKDASFARLKNVSLSWQFPLGWVKKVGVQSVSMVLSVQNLFTITGYDGPDPETQSLMALPPLRTGTVGFNLIF